MFDERAQLAADGTPTPEITWIDAWIRGGPQRTLHDLRREYDLCEHEVRQLCDRLEEVVKGKDDDPEFRAHLKGTMEAGITALAQVNAEVLVHAGATMYQDPKIPPGWKDTLLSVMSAARERSAEREQKAGDQ